MKNRVRAIVRATIDVESDSVWGGECTFDQIVKQAEDGVRGMLQGNPLALAKLPSKVIRFAVQQVIVSREDKEE